MSQYTISQLREDDKRAFMQVDQLLHEEGISRDKNLDCTCVMYDDDYQVIATGSCFKNTLRCFAVRSDHQGEGLLNEIISFLLEIQLERGNTHLFLYTKVKSAPFFRDLGFYEIARVDGTMVFMENRKNGFAEYLKKLERKKTAGRSAAIVMNANPFTLGHQHLVECASKAYDFVHVFVLSEDVSLVPFPVRKRLVEKGTSHLSNVICHESGPYMISNATFPSYFLKDEDEVVRAHARLDIEVFSKIAEALSIQCRYVGEEPFSQVTSLYNEVMKKHLPLNGISCEMIQRKSMDTIPISASSVRQAIKEEDWDLLCKLVPESTYEFFRSPEGTSVAEKIKKSDNVIHY